MFTIDKGIAPPPRYPHAKGYADAVRQLKPGDSVLLPITKQQAHSVLYYLCAKSTDALERSEYRLASDGPGTRIWRV